MGISLKTVSETTFHGVMLLIMILGWRACQFSWWTVSFFAIISVYKENPGFLYFKPHWNVLNRICNGIYPLCLVMGLRGIFRRIWCIVIVSTPPLFPSSLQRYFLISLLYDELLFLINLHINFRYLCSWLNLKFDPNLFWNQALIKHKLLCNTLGDRFLRC